MLAFHNEHIGSNSFLAYFSTESSVTPAMSPTLTSHTFLYDDKQFLSGHSWSEKADAGCFKMETASKNSILNTLRRKNSQIFTKVLDLHCYKNIFFNKAYL
ncbi:uncharacterized protein LOC116655877 [Drosophila ananassae]|uniref:uncharacterized protein LOC116655877 n=1 Tax=Drosophila ananassae TaxID=7217 RepID=UPI001CFF8FB3|nr:uncharacterized protein LOC116655877 [Drosophila ananassae]